MEEYCAAIPGLKKGTFAHYATQQGQATVPGSKPGRPRLLSVASMVSAEQRAIETVGSIGLPPSDICLNTPYFLRSAAPS